MTTMTTIATARRGVIRSTTEGIKPTRSNVNYSSSSESAKKRGKGSSSNRRTMCFSEKHDGIWWPQTPVQQTAVRPCPPNSKGIHEHIGKQLTLIYWDQGKHTAFPRGPSK